MWKFVLTWHHGFLPLLAAFIVIFAYPLWVVCADGRRNRHTRARRKSQNLRREVARHEKSDACYESFDWAKWCDHHDLPQSTRITLMATVDKEKARH